MVNSHERRVEGTPGKELTPLHEVDWEGVAAFLDGEWKTQEMMGGRLIRYMSNQRYLWVHGSEGSISFHPFGNPIPFFTGSGVLNSSIQVSHMSHIHLEKPADESGIRTVTFVGARVKLTIDEEGGFNLSNFPQASAQSQI